MLNNYIKDIAKHYFSCAIDKLNYAKQAGGFSHATNLKISYQNKDYLLRCFPDNQSTQHRIQEVAISKIAGELQISPIVYYHDSSCNFQLIEYIEGNTLSPVQLKHNKVQTALQKSLQTLHEAVIPDSFQAKNIVDSIISFIKKLNNTDDWFKNINNLYPLEQWQHWLGLQLKENQQCIHNDLNLLNILIDENEKPWLIDWTDAGLGSKYSDYAMLSLFNAKIYKQNPNIQRYRTLRILRLVVWSLEQAQRLAPNELFDPASINPSQSSPTIDLILNAIVEGKTRLSSANDFLSLTPHFLHHYVRELQI